MPCHKTINFLVTDNFLNNLTGSRFNDASNNIPEFVIRKNSDFSLSIKSSRIFISIKPFYAIPKGPVKVLYLNETDYNEDKLIEDDRIKEGYSLLNLPKGLVISFIKDNKDCNPIIEYEYCEFYQSYDNLTEWAEKIIQKYKDENKIFDRIQKHWWKIERYECTLVGRDRKWWLSVQPKIIDFWEDVLHYREVGIQELLDKKAAKKIKKIKIKDKKSSPKKNIFEIDKAVVEKIQNDYLIDSD